MLLRTTSARWTRGGCAALALPALLTGLVALDAGAAWAQEADEEEAPAVPEVIGPCTPPEPVALPEDATREKLRALVKSVKGYIGDSEAYIICLTRYERTLGEDAEARAELVTSHNAMVDAMQDLAARFNKARKAALQSASE